MAIVSTDNFTTVKKHNSLLAHGLVSEIYFRTKLQKKTHAFRVTFRETGALVRAVVCVQRSCHVNSWHKPKHGYYRPGFAGITRRAV